MLMFVLVCEILERGHLSCVRSHILYGYGRGWERHPQSQAPTQNKEALMVCSWEGKGNCWELSGKRRSKKFREWDKKEKDEGKKTNTYVVLKVKE